MVQLSIWRQLLGWVVIPVSLGMIPVMVGSLPINGKNPSLDTRVAVSSP